MASKKIWIRFKVVLNSKVYNVQCIVVNNNELYFNSTGLKNKISCWLCEIRFIDWSWKQYGQQASKGRHFIERDVFNWSHYYITPDMDPQKSLLSLLNIQNWSFCICIIPGGGGLLYNILGLN